VIDQEPSQADAGDLARGPDGVQRSDDPDADTIRHPASQHRAIGDRAAGVAGAETRGDLRRRSVRRIVLVLDAIRTVPVIVDTMVEVYPVRLFVLDLRQFDPPPAPFTYNACEMHQYRTPVPAVLDASFWINAVRSRVAHYLVDYFSLVAPPRVAAETTALLDLPHPPEAAVLFREWQQRGLIREATPLRAVDRFEPGENEAIALAQECGWVLLIDNSAPRDWSRGPGGLRVIDSPAFVVFLYDQGRLDYAQATTIIAQSQAARRVARDALLLLVALMRRKGENAP
jgi:hypothetical protein